MSGEYVERGMGGGDGKGWDGDIDGINCGGGSVENRSDKSSEIHGNGCMVFMMMMMVLEAAVLQMVVD